MTSVAIGREVTAAMTSLAGTSLKPQHFRDILGQPRRTGWFELHTENLMGAGGLLHHYLGEIRKDYPFSLHGVGLSLGSAGGIDERHLERIKAVVDRYQPFLVSEHVAWTETGGLYMADLLPLPYTPEALDCMARNVDRMQTALGREILVENPSGYDRFGWREMSEPEFLNALASRTGCGILLDVNNVHVAGANLGFDAADYILQIEARRVGQIHLAGHCAKCFGGDHILIDDHGSVTAPEVWRLYRLALDHVGPVPTLIEWDSNLPEFAVLAGQAARAAQAMDEAQWARSGEIAHAVAG